MKLKSWSHFFQAIKRGDKTHDLRKKDRHFFIGQHLTLQEYDPFAGRYTGDEVEVEVTYITDEKTPCAFSSAVLEKGYAILSLRLVKRKGPVTINVANVVDVATFRKQLRIGDLEPIHPIDARPLEPLYGFETEDDN